MVKIFSVCVEENRLNGAIDYLNREISNYQMDKHLEITSVSTTITYHNGNSTVIASVVGNYSPYR